MNIKTLNESLKKLLEGEVIDFNKFRQEKIANLRKERSQKVADELFNNPETDKFIKDNILHINILGVKVTSCETHRDLKFFGNGATYSFEDFQDLAYKADYFLTRLDDTCNCDFIVYLKVENEEEQVEFRGRLILGSGKENVNLMNYIEERAQRDLDKAVNFDNYTVPNQEQRYAKDFEVYQSKTVESEPLPDYVKDYRKNPQDVAVGDILTCSWGYSMTIVDYYRVTERKAKSIKLEKLENKVLSGGGYSGEVIPSDIVAADRYQEYVKDRLFRVGVKWSKDVVCQVNGHSCYYWDGKPDSYDHMD